MSFHPLKLTSLISLFGLIANQLSLLFWLEHDYRLLFTAVLTLLLIIPLRGLFSDRRYTYKWTGFLTLLYFFIGISESFANPDLKIYGAVNILLSGVLYISSIYYSRYLRINKN